MDSTMRERPWPMAVKEALAPFDLRLAVLFGSMARGDARPDSDLDVAVLAREPLSAEQRSRIVEALVLACDRPVDLVDLRDAGEPLLGRIVAEGQRLLGSSSEWGNLLSRHLANQADFVPLQNHILRTRREAWIKR